jgi:hypothetical protein
MRTGVERGMESACGILFRGGRTYAVGGDWHETREGQWLVVERETHFSYGTRQKIERHARNVTIVLPLLGPCTTPLQRYLEREERRGGSPA